MTNPTHPAAVFLQGNPSNLLPTVSFATVLVSAFVVLVAWVLVRWNSKIVDYFSRRTARGRFLFNVNPGVPDAQVVTDVVVPFTIDPELAIKLGYEAAYSSPFLVLDKPVVVLLLDRFDGAPYCVLRVEGCVYDPRSAPKMQSDITVRVKAELRRVGVLAPIEQL